MDAASIPPSITTSRAGIQKTNRTGCERLRTAVRSLPAAAQRQQPVDNIGIGGGRQPTVRGSHAGVKGVVRVDELFRPGVVEVRERALLEPRRR